MQFFQNCSIVDTGMTAPGSEQLRIALTQLANDTLQQNITSSAHIAVRWDTIT